MIPRYYLLAVRLCRLTGHRLTPLCHHILRLEGSDV